MCITIFRVPSTGPLANLLLWSPGADCWFHVPYAVSPKDSTLGFVKLVFPFWVPIMINSLIFRVPRKRDHNLDNHPDREYCEKPACDRLGFDVRSSLRRGKNFPPKNQYSVLGLGFRVVVLADTVPTKSLTFYSPTCIIRTLGPRPHESALKFSFLSGQSAQ